MDLIYKQLLIGPEKVLNYFQEGISIFSTSPPPFPNFVFLVKLKFKLEDWTSSLSAPRGFCLQTKKKCT